MSSNPSSKKRKIPSAADYIVQYDLQDMMDEVKQDFQQVGGAPRLLKQKEIASRFRSYRKAKESKP